MHIHIYNNFSFFNIIKVIFDLKKKKITSRAAWLVDIAGTATNCNRPRHTAAAHCNTPALKSYSPGTKGETHNNALQHAATCCNTLISKSCKPGTNCATQTATQCNTLRHTATQSATHCNTLRHTAIHCNTLQHTATHLYLRHIQSWYTLRNTFQHTATHSNTLQHTATYYKCNNCNAPVLESYSPGTNRATPT